MRRRPYQRRQRSSHPLTFNATDPHQRIRHRRSTHVQTVSRIRRRRALTVRIRHVLMQAAPEGSGMSRRRTHTPPPRIGDLIRLRNGDGLIGGNGSVIDRVTERLIHRR